MFKPNFRCAVERRANMADQTREGQKSKIDFVSKRQKCGSAAVEALNGSHEPKKRMRYGTIVYRRYLHPRSRGNRYKQGEV